VTETKGYRLSPQQRRVWTLLAEGKAADRVQGVFRVPPGADASTLRQRAVRLAADHEILRTIYRRVSGFTFPLQVVLPELLPVFEVEERPTVATDSAQRRLLEEEYSAPLDPEKGPLLRLRLLPSTGGGGLAVVTVCSLAADRRSLDLMARALVSGGPAGSADILQYADYSEWANEMLEEGRKTPSRERGRGLPVPRLPFERGARAGISAAQSSIGLTAALASRVQAAATREEATVEDFLLACWATLLSRWTGEPAFEVRQVLEGRGQPELASAIGLFSRALPVPARIEASTKFDDVLRACARSARENAERVDTAGEEDARSAAVGFEGPGAEISPLAAERVVLESFKLRLSFQAAEDGLRGTLAYDPAAYAADGMERLAAALPVLIDAAARSPESAVGDLPILSESERRTIVESWNPAPSEFPRGKTVLDLFEERAHRAPEALAVAGGGETLSYGELNARADRVARLLASRGVGEEDRVGLSVDRSRASLVGILGIWKAGAAYVAVHPDHPRDRVAGELAESGARILLARGAAEGGGFPGETISLEECRTARPDDGPAAAGRSRPDSLAYVLYTSGSTGAPKGAAIEHAALTNYSWFIAHELLGLDPEDGERLSFATASHLSADLGNTAVFPALISGGSVHLVPADAAVDGGAFAAWMAERSVDVLKIVPSHLAALMATSDGRNVLPRRVLIFGGEALSWDLVDQIRARGASCRIVNHYGPTEATIGCLTYPVQKSAEARSFAATVPIGRPIANLRAYVVGPGGDLLPPGVAGELLVGGVGLARGYWERPDETAQKFIADPYSGQPGARLYRTGDRARRLPDGSVEFLGRVDFQVKIRGFRVEPGEIEAALTRHPRVRAAVVVARSEASSEPRLVAYVVLEKNGAPSTEDLRAWLRARVPDYMVPSGFVCLDALPLAGSGKVDRGALPPVDTEPGRRYVAPRTPSEVVVADTWREVLRLDRVGAEDNFFDLGGHSLLLTQVVSRLRKIFKSELPIRWLFETPTVSGLAARIDEAERQDLSRILDELESLPEPEPAPGDRATRVGS
jgi:amino acid adenylation domain-containing protein